MTRVEFGKWSRPDHGNYCDHYATTADGTRCERCGAMRERHEPMTQKRGDWKSIDGMYHFTVEQAREARDAFAARFPEYRLRIKSFSSLGYSVQAFVERGTNR